MLDPNAIIMCALHAMEGIQGLHTNIQLNLWCPESGWGGGVQNLHLGVLSLDRPYPLPAVIRQTPDLRFQCVCPTNFR